MDSDSESKLISLITQIMYLEGPRDLLLDSESIPLIIQIIHLVRSMDLDSLPKPESELMSLVTQTIHLFYSMNLDRQPKPLSELVSVITQLVKSEDLDLNLDLDSESDSERYWFIWDARFEHEGKPGLMSLINQIFCLVISMNSKWEKLISLSPQVQGYLRGGKFQVVEKVWEWSSNEWKCLPFNWKKEFGRRKGEDATHFLCCTCNGKNHEENEQAPVEIKHPLHPKHSLQLALLQWSFETRKCYCCEEDLETVFYYCSVCDFAMNIACVEKPPALSIDHCKWHEHKLAHFPRQASLTCDICALADSSSPFYICLLCDFLVHQSCLNLPRVIRISRHLHRLSFTPSFDQGDLSCGVCRRKIDNHYGGYCCIKNDCSYAAHSRCATQSNVWDGIDLEGQPEEIEEEIAEPFVRISDGIIQHFSHQHHHLKLDNNTGRSYDEDKMCQACITPIYFGNFYSCMQCEFILHETCADLSRKIHHPIHPHMLTLDLVGGNFDVTKDKKGCSACLWLCTNCFFYKCDKEGCTFQLHVQCATISEPLVHEAHMHPLFLTSKPGEERRCSMCNDEKETFNCIECEFAMCYKCATIPQKVMYKHDKHILTLTYGNETSHETNWCEACEGKINSHEDFYRCDEYCCVTLHIECLIGKELYMKPGSSWFYGVEKVDVLVNNHRMSRPTCSSCEERCPQRIVFQYSGSVFCSSSCFPYI